MGIESEKRFIQESAENKEEWCRKLECMTNDEILAIIPMEGNFSQQEKDGFCGGVRRCAQYVLSK